MDLDILGQQPFLNNLYTQITLCYPLSDTSSPTPIVDTLILGLKRLSESFPWTAGQVILENEDDTNTKVYKIKPLAETPRLIVKDLTKDSTAPTMEALRKARFPMSLLDEDFVAFIRTLAAGTEAVAESSPVLAIQATFVDGGLLLTFVAQHSVMDMTGQGQVMYLLSKACHNESFTGEEIRTGNLARKNLIPFLGESYQPGPELLMQIKKPPSESIPTNTSSSAPPCCSWKYFSFSSASLSTLKSQASKTLTSGYVSTDDALSAYIWQAITRARLHRLGPNIKTTFGRAVDPRRYLGLPETYTGLVQNMVYHTSNGQKLINEPLGTIAAEFRSAVDPKTSKIGYNTQALVTQYYRATDRSAVGVTVNIDPSTDLTLSSWAKVDCYGLDFNLGLGMPECVRRPKFIPVEGLLYLMPRAPDGEIVAALCLRDEDMQRLREDEELAKYATYIG